MAIDSSPCVESTCWHSGGKQVADHSYVVHRAITRDDRGPSAHMRSISLPYCHGTPTPDSDGDD